MKATNDRWKEKTKLLIDSIALTGQREFYTEPIKDLKESSIEAYIWRRVAISILRSILFPAELYQICHTIACMTDEQLEKIAKGEQCN